MPPEERELKDTNFKRRECAVESGEEEKGGKKIRFKRVMKEQSEVKLKKIPLNIRKKIVNMTMMVARKMNPYRKKNLVRLKKRYKIL